MLFQPQQLAIRSCSTLACCVFLASFSLSAQICYRFSDPQPGQPAQHSVTVRIASIPPTLTGTPQQIAGLYYYVGWFNSNPIFASFPDPLPFQYSPYNSIVVQSGAKIYTYNNFAIEIDDPFSNPAMRLFINGDSGDSFGQIGMVFYACAGCGVIFPNGLQTTLPPASAWAPQFSAFNYPSFGTISSFYYPPSASGSETVSFSVTAVDSQCSPAFPPPPTSPKLKLTLAQPEIPPSVVKASTCYTDIETGACLGRVTIPQMDSTVKVDVQLLDALGNPDTKSAGILITFDSTAIDVSMAGHFHDGAPGGTFQNADSQVSFTCTLTANGSCSIFFLAPTNAGNYEISATTVSGLHDSQGLRVIVPNLVLLEPSSEGDYTLTGANNFHPVNHYGTSYLTTLIDVVGSTFKHYTGKKLGINDMSLAWGGLFDIGPIDFNNYSFWSFPHILHRLGNSVDIDKKPLSSPEKEFLYQLMTTFELVKVKESPIHYEVIQP